MLLVVGLIENHGDQLVYSKTLRSSTLSAHTSADLCSCPPELPDDAYEGTKVLFERSFERWKGMAIGDELS